MEGNMASPFEMEMTKRGSRASASASRVEGGGLIKGPCKERCSQ